MTEIILVLTVSSISMGLLIWIGLLSKQFLKYFIQIIEEINEEKKKNY